MVEQETYDMDPSNIAHSSMNINKIFEENTIDKEHIFSLKNQK